MQHIGFWSMLTLLIYWGKTNVSQRKAENISGAYKEVALELNKEKSE